jgi:Tol biopolymer transport system component
MLKKVALGGGAPVVLVERVNPPGPQDFGPEGIAWGNDGSIVYSRILGAGLRVVRESGSEPQEFTTLDQSKNEVSHRLPHFLPDGSAVLFTVLRYTVVTPNWTRAQIWAKSLKTGERKLILENGMDARYIGNGALVFARQGKLFAIRFDPEKLTTTGTAVPVLDGVNQALYGINAVSWTGAAQFSVSDTGTLVYAPGSYEPPFLSELVSVDRIGHVTPIAGPQVRSHFAARLTPDGHHIAFSELYLEKDIWLFDPARGTEDRITYEGQNAFPMFSPTGSLLAFRSDRSGPLRIYLSKESNWRDATPITDGSLDVPSSWTADGKELVFVRDGDIYAVTATEPHKIRTLVNTTSEERFPEVSPDGKWLAYVSNESGRTELYVQPYGATGKRVTVTNEGAQEPAWSKNSNEIFYVNAQRMMAVRFKTSDSEFLPEKPTVLFDLPTGSQGGGATVRTVYDVTPDGKFLMIRSGAEVAQQRQQKLFPTIVRFVFNWTDEVHRIIASAK